MGKWTAEEIEILKCNSQKSLKELQELLPGRNINSIKLKRSKLGISPKKLSSWTSDEIEILKRYAPILYTDDLVEMLPRHTTKSISQKCAKLKLFKTEEFMRLHGVKFLNNFHSFHNYKLDQFFTIDDLDNETYQVLMGSMLGDGGVSRQSRHHKNTEPMYIFNETHGYAQKEYAIWKHDMLTVFSPSKISCLNTKPKFSTPSHPIFNQLRKEFYNEKEQRKAYVPLKHIDRLDELGLLIWYLDDGWLEYSPYIGSSLFTKENLDAIVDVINHNLNVSLYVKKSKLDNRICFAKRNRDILMPKWVNLAKRYELPKCMWYKIKGLEN